MQRAARSGGGYYARTIAHERTVVPTQRKLEDSPPSHALPPKAAPLWRGKAGEKKDHLSAPPHSGREWEALRSYHCT